MVSLHGKYFIALLTLLSLFPLLIIRVSYFNITFFWLYSVLMTFHLVFLYYFTYQYKPITEMNHRPTVTVVIPCKNEEEVIVQTITAIIESDYPADKLRAVVVDDGSTDRTYQIAKQYEGDRVKVVRHEHNKGKRQAFASGFRSSDSEIVLCIDSDTIVAKDAIRLLVQPFIDGNVVAVCGHGEAANKDKNLLTKLQHYWYQKMFTLTKGMESSINTVTCCSGLLAAYRRDILNVVIDEWLNEKFMGVYIHFGDDRQLTNLSSRGANGISTKDAKVMYQSNAIGYTMVPDNFKQFFKQQLRWKRAWLHGVKLAGKFMWRKRFPVPLYFYTYQLMTFCTPAIIFVWIIIKPLNGEIMSTVIFLMSVLFIATIHGLNTWILTHREQKSSVIDYIFYMILFVPITIGLCLLNVYAWSTLWKGGWMTRSDSVIKEVSHVEDIPRF
jgi:hyaluronan synthase